MCGRYDGIGEPIEYNTAVLYFLFKLLVLVEGVMRHDIAWTSTFQAKETWHSGSLMYMRAVNSISTYLFR